MSDNSWKLVGSPGFGDSSTGSKSIPSVATFIAYITLEIERPYDLNFREFLWLGSSLFPFRTCRDLKSKSLMGWEIQPGRNCCPAPFMLETMRWLFFMVYPKPSWIGGAHFGFLKLGKKQHNSEANWSLQDQACSHWACKIAPSFSLHTCGNVPRLPCPILACGHLLPVDSALEEKVMGCRKERASPWSPDSDRFVQAGSTFA